MADQIGVAGYAAVFGQPDPTISWNGHTLTIFSEVSVTPDADLAQSRNNDGELLSQNRTNKRNVLRFSARAKGATIAEAQAIANDIPRKGDAVTITSNDPQVATGSGNSSLVDDASKRYSPEGELIIDFSITTHLDKVFVALT
jgi:hypothetical protein